MDVTLNGVTHDAQTPCGHCRHGLIYHFQKDAGSLVQCSICSCLRGPNEDITQPHNFGGAA